MIDFYDRDICFIEYFNMDYIPTQDEVLNLIKEDFKDLSITAITDQQAYLVGVMQGIDNYEKATQNNYYYNEISETISNIRAVVNNKLTSIIMTQYN